MLFLHIYTCVEQSRFLDYEHICAWLCSSEVEVEYLPWSFFTFHIETRSLAWLRAWHSGKPGQPACSWIHCLHFSHDTLQADCRAHIVCTGRSKDPNASLFPAGTASAFLPSPSTISGIITHLCILLFLNFLNWNETTTLYLLPSMPPFSPRDPM